MSELPKKYDSHGDKRGTSNDDSRNNKVSSSKACNTKDTQRQRKHPRSDEGCSRHILLNHQETTNININQNQHSIPKPKEKDATALVPIRYIPDLKNKHQRHQFDAIKVGMKFTGVIDGSFPGGYFITVGVGNLPTLSGVAMLNSDQPARIEGDFNENVPLIPTKIGLTQENQNGRTNSLRNAGNLYPCNDINMDKILPVVKVEDEFIPEYSDSEMFCSNEVRIPYEHVVLKPVNPPIGMPIHQTNSVDKGKCISNEYYSAPTGCGTMIDPFLQRNFSSSALSITPPSDQVATSSFTGNTTAAETRNFLQHHQESQKQVVNTFPTLNLKDRLMRVPGPPGSSSAQAQQSDHAQPNSSSPTSKKSKHMQDNN